MGAPGSVHWLSTQSMADAADYGDFRPSSPSQHSHRTFVPKLANLSGGSLRGVVELNSDALDFEKNAKASQECVKMYAANIAEEVMRGDHMPDEDEVRDCAP